MGDGSLSKKREGLVDTFIDRVGRQWMATGAIISSAEIRWSSHCIAGSQWRDKCWKINCSSKRQCLYDIVNALLVCQWQPLFCVIKSPCKQWWCHSFTGSAMTGDVLLSKKVQGLVDSVIYRLANQWLSICPVIHSAGIWWKVILFLGSNDKMNGRQSMAHSTPRDCMISSMDVWVSLIGLIAECHRVNHTLAL